MYVCLINCKRERYSLYVNVIILAFTNGISKFFLAPINEIYVSFRSDALRETMEGQGPEITFLFQFGLIRDAVSVPQGSINLKTIKDLACDFINTKVILELDMYFVEIRFCFSFYIDT